MSNLRNQISTLLGSGSRSSSGADQLFSATSGGSYQSLDQLISATAGSLAQLQSAIQAQASSVAKASSANSSSSGTSGSGNAFTSVAGAILGGFTLSPIVRGLMGLFGGGGDDSAPAPLPKFTAPPRLSIAGGLTDGAAGPVAVDYGQYGQARAISGGTASQPQITVNVQAIDSQSFLDHSDDIARAVKRAMLESSSLNDVVSEL